MARARLKSILTALIFSGVITSCGTANSGSEPVQEYTSGDSENITPLASAVPTPPTTPVNENLSGYAGSDTEFVSNLPKVALFSITKHWKRGDSTFPELSIIVKENNVTLSEIIINRGNCQLLYVNEPNVGSSLPMTVKFGDKVSMRGLCDPAEITLVSDQGSETFSW